MNELERALFALGRELDVPQTPDLVPVVMARAASRRRRVPVRRLALAIAFVLVALLAATLAIPSARSALFRVLHIGGEEIRFVDQLPEVSPGRPLEPPLGERVSLAEAQRKAGFRLRGLERPPDRVYFGANGTIWFLYGAPEHVRLLLAQTRLTSFDARFTQKMVAEGTQVESVEVDGTPGAFLSGRPHVVILLNRAGRPVAETARLARDVLVWSRGGVTYRLEGDFTRDEALRFAHSLR